MTLKKLIKGVASRTPGATPLLKRAWVESRRLGERALFVASAPPQPSSSIVLASSGRSGSTWLADILATLPQTQLIFEPLDPRNSITYRELMQWPAGLTPSAFKRQYLRPKANAPEWRAFWEDVLRGKIRTYLTDYSRTSFFPKRFLIKVIRANMMLGFVAEQFQPTLIFLMRHPAAVINSMAYRVKARWPAKAQDLLGQEALVEDFLRPWVTEIEQISDEFEALVVWWAVENRVALSQLQGKRHYLIFYEWLSLYPQDELARLCNSLDLGVISASTSLLYRYSRMTSQKQRASREKDVMTRLSAWQRELSKEEQSLVFRWMERMEISFYGAGVLPTHASSLEGVL